jgi:hypothetical protein
LLAGLLLGKVNEKSPGLAPPSTAFAVSSSGRVPVFVKVTNKGALGAPPTVVSGKVRVAGATVAVVSANPEPVSVTVCGTPRAPGVELVICTEAVRKPAADGVKVTVTLQNPPAGITPVQESTAVKSAGAGLAPEAITASEIASGAFP